MWREGVTAGASCVAANTSIPFASIVRFDELGNPSASYVKAEAAGLRLMTAASSSPPTTSSLFPPMLSGPGVSGWMYLDLDNRVGASSTNPYSSNRTSQNWLIVHMKADGRYAVDYDATTLANGCSGAGQIQTLNINERSAQ